MYARLEYVLGYVRWVYTFDLVDECTLAQRTRLYCNVVYRVWLSVHYYHRWVQCVGDDCTSVQGMLSCTLQSGHYLLHCWVYTLSLYTTLECIGADAAFVSLFYRLVLFLCTNTELFRAALPYRIVFLFLQIKDRLVLHFHFLWNTFPLLEIMCVFDTSFMEFVPSLLECCPFLGPTLFNWLFSCPSDMKSCPCL